ncbi:NgoPII family restriction endonuclease [Patescibacteria group bacterium]|nr:NgoPII family restriction endonuclease [Patescibacteria group bacterium]
MTNLLTALVNLVENPITDIAEHSHSLNRANSMGDALEYYVKDLFCDSMDIDNLARKNEIYSEHFSYLGNQNNPPDIMIRGGDAIEVKKIESMRSGIALNSSYPKDKLYSDNPMIKEECRSCEEWDEKDMIYIVGVTTERKLKALWFIYGSCYAANKETYERIKQKISSGLSELNGVELSDTKELGRVNNVDPLGITYLRIRGMWHISNPISVFDYITEVELTNELTVNAIILKDKYESFPEESKTRLERLISDNLTIQNVRVKSPNNPANLLDAKLIKFIK